MVLYEHIKKRYNIKVISNYNNKEILGLQSIDIYIPGKKIGIEYQGAQHFRPLSIYGGYQGFINTCERDLKKYNICKNNGIKLFYFTYNKNDVTTNYIDNVITQEEELFKILDELIY